MNWEELVSANYTCLILKYLPVSLFYYGRNFCQVTRKRKTQRHKFNIFLTIIKVLNYHFYYIFLIAIVCIIFIIPIKAFTV